MPFAQGYVAADVTIRADEKYKVYHHSYIIRLAFVILQYETTQFVTIQYNTALCFRLETSLSELMKKLKDLFSYLFLSPQTVNTRFREATQMLRDKIKNELSDYKHYLSVKAQRNIPMTSYPFFINSRHWGTDYFAVVTDGTGVRSSVSSTAN